MDNSHKLSIIEEKMCADDRKVWSRELKPDGKKASLQGLIDWINVTQLWRGILKLLQNEELRNGASPEIAQSSAPQSTDENLPDLQPINLTSCDHSDAEHSLLMKGPAFCPTPKDVNWQKTIDDLDKFERRIRLAVFHHGRSPDNNNHTADRRFLMIPSTSDWMALKSNFPEDERSLNNVKKDTPEPKNLRKAKDNLTREDR